MDDFSKLLVEVNKKTGLLTNAILDIASALDDYSFFVEAEYNGCVIDIDIIRDILDDLKKALMQKRGKTYE